MSDYNLTLLDLKERCKSCCIYVDYNSAKKYIINTDIILPSVLSMVDGKLEKPEPIKTWLWTHIVTVPLLLFWLFLPLTALRIVSLVAAGIWFVYTLYQLRINVNYRKHWSEIEICEYN